MKIHQRVSDGYVSLMSVILLGAIGIAASTSIVLIGLGMSQSGNTYDHSNRALSLAEACAEEALEIVRESTAYTGTGSLSFTLGSCSYSVETTGESSRRISASGTVGSTLRRISIDVNTLYPSITIGSWRDITD